MDPTFVVSLEGPGSHGFRITGGKDCDMPIRIALVRDDTRASDAKLEAGLRILQINGMSTSKMTQEMAKRAIRSANGKLNLILQGTRSNLLAQEQNLDVDERRDEWIPHCNPPSPPPTNDIEDKLPETLISLDNIDDDSGYSLEGSVASDTESLIDPIPGVSFPQFENLEVSKESIPKDEQHKGEEENRPPSPPPPPLPEKQSPPHPPPPPTQPPPPPPVPCQNVKTEEKKRKGSKKAPKVAEGLPIVREDDAMKMKCGGCLKKIKAKHMFVKVEGISWHGGCLNCKVCHVSLFHKEYRVMEGQPLCSNCGV